MRRLRLDRGGRSVEHFDSRALTYLPLGVLAGHAQVGIIRLRRGGRVGRHAAVVAQLFVAVSGEGWVAGGDGKRQPLRAGQAVLWDEGEEHEAGTESGLVALLVEAEEFDLRL